MNTSILATMQFPPDHGGVQRYLHSIARWLTPSGLTVMIPPVSSAVPTDVRVIQRPFLTRFFYPHWLPFLYSLVFTVRSLNVKKVLVGHALPLATACRIAQRFVRFDYGVFTHGMDVTAPLRHPTRSKTLKVALSGAQHVFAVSRFTKHVVQSIGIDSRNISLVPPAITPSELPAASESVVHNLRKSLRVPQPTIALAVSRLVKRKGHEMLLNAVEQVRRRHPNLVLIIVGTGPEESTLKSYTRNHGLERNVMFTGDIPDEQLSGWYSLADFFVLTPLQSPHDIDVEGFGLVYLEAQYYGKPVIASATGGVPEAVGPQSGVCIPPGNTDLLVKAMIEFASDKEKRARMSAYARTWARTSSWEKSLQPVLHFLNS